MLGSWQKLILLILFAVFKYCLGKRGGQQFFKLVIICRGPWVAYSAHTWEQNSGLDSGDHGDISTSPDCALPIEMQTCAETASLSFFVFCNIILGSADLFFLLPLSTLFQQ